MIFQKEYIKSIVYGGLDGIVSTFALVAGVSGASLPSAIIIILGFAHLIAEGISMSAGDYLSSKSQNEYGNQQKKKYNKKYSKEPKKFKMEILDYYISKGFNKLESVKLTNIIYKNKNASSELLTGSDYIRNPRMDAIYTFLAFIIFGFVPVFVYVFSFLFPGIIVNHFFFSVVLTCAVLFGLGAIRHSVTGRNWIVSGFEVLFIGGLAASIAYLIGFAISGIV